MSSPSSRAALAASACVAAATFATARAQEPTRPLTITDMRRFAEVGEPQLSPDGESIVYTVSTIDTARDQSTGDIWL
ncbi:MAG: hypothetical protein M3Y05_14795, partial [Gemmatimonadota bacterium]|nr:hypothetical protein [Gemmatimonadota bacterium]